MTGMAMGTAEAVVIPVEEELKRAAEKVEANFTENKTKIHRFPANLRGVTKEGRYLVPSAVAIGPYHHDLPHLQEAEEVKRAAAYYFWRDWGDSAQGADPPQSAEAAYEKILSVAGNVRSCYVGDTAAGMSCEADFAAMMFRDGCFLLQFMIFIRSSPGGLVAPSLQGWFNSKLASILRDIFLMENQIPWLVLQTLMSFKPALDVEDFIARAGLGFEARLDLVKRPLVLNGSYTPAHLLGLLRYYQCGSIPIGRTDLHLPEGVTSLPQSSSAIELAEIGIQLVANDTSQLKDMGIYEGAPRLFGGIFLAPLVIDDLKACWLVNMVALEASITTGLGDEDIVSSYVLLLAMLMNREEDVHELRAKGLVRGGFSDLETLEFFKNLVKQLFVGLDYFRILAELEAYRRKRRLLIPVHKFVYNNFKAIVTVFSVIGVLVGIFKALISIKQHQQ
ncbi:Os11g0278300 [Oryza sativa Japonica Group]|uniref:Os11g0278300 protein n=3 Tax=Oryza TaxID=4527 RepID=A0A0P0Y1E7_ORYSJ|nr:Plant protein of unknown function [Oryza sativa Japonica Group]KAB8114943.1 hypothetical protein EE612_054756 [Oryza sativa]ABA92637.2 expressed protein [Oryza sativa Japonica Group]EAZ18082.1 hypothetical protein OsJ_33627 [Oryza sativa Japonica Group]BAF28051.2 Os11g0278300 [Oryza sativa Japonica Group]|eukprot:NP_001067688.2 Os11g0278300 [Oryza sativa Japonica Group]